MSRKNYLAAIIELEKYLLPKWTLKCINLDDWAANNICTDPLNIPQNFGAGTYLWGPSSSKVYC